MALKEDAGLPEWVNAFIHAMNSRDPTPAVGPAGPYVDASDPELAPRKLESYPSDEPIDKMAGPPRGDLVQMVREVYPLPKRLQGKPRKISSWRKSPLQGVPQGTA